MLPKDCARYIVNSVILLTTDLEEQNKQLRQQLKKLQCAGCHNFPTHERHFRTLCEICDFYICNECVINTTQDGRITCERHPNVCGICLEDYIEPNYQTCTICHIRICGECVEGNRHLVENCLCGLPIISCGQENYRHEDFTLRQGKCQNCDSDLCAHNQTHICSFCDRRCERCHITNLEGEYCNNCENWFPALR